MSRFPYLDDGGSFEKLVEEIRQEEGDEANVMKRLEFIIVTKFMQKIREEATNVSFKKDVLDAFVPKRKRGRLESEDSEEEKKVKRIKKPSKGQKAKSEKPKKSKKRINFESIGLNVSVATPPPELQRKIDGKGGVDSKLVIMKELFQSDLDYDKNRLQIPWKQIQNLNFLTEDEKISLNSHEVVDVTLMEPCGHESEMVIRQWNMRSSGIYCLTTSWNRVLDRNLTIVDETNGEIVKMKEFKLNDVIQLWSFRVNGKLWLALIKVWDAPYHIDNDSGSGNSRSRGSGDGAITSHKGGNVDISIKDASWKPKHQKAEFSHSLMGFFLAKDAAFARITNESIHTTPFCVLSSRYVKLMFKFDELTVNSTYSGSIAIDDPDQYSLIFGNCIWVFTCIKQRPTVDKIHIIMGALLLVKTLKMICASEDKLYVSKTGTPHGWDVAFYIFGFFKGIMLFTVIILIGTGWSFLKPYLQEREKKVLMIVIPLQVVENIAYVVINETGPATKDWMTWNQVFLLIDIICCCAVFFPIIWSIRSLREASKTDGKATRNLQKLTLFKQFYIFVVGYLYFTRVVVSSIGALLDYRYEWVMNALAEGASFIFYVFIFYNFQPIERNPYLVIDDEEENAASQILQDDESFQL
ncbi:hypothetical protein JCGZ_23573 [Jatropha curcas]|uniref:GOST seven transmembrane domain-containing protein n=1 Tax=Jatropha curcas TaxID=180498 RepID=A0A067JUU4_JATCU|nr:hypothetical protein JCGZ_23573 [Jatropha curcas]